jgi:predicted amidophosphoribosyltransferase
MTGSQRRKNLKNVFELSMNKLEEFPSHVAIVDDVVTTGSTASAVAKLLKKHGVEKVTVLAVALAN